ncbi:MAG: MBL fold metallo-hydrolase [Burkholderiales bacterium]|nr:MBL fold metallo-hydrolase [Burkholderiales bacterium]
MQQSASLLRLPRLSATVTASALCAALLAGCASSPPAPDAATLIARAEQALGGATASTLSVTARGTGNTFGQAFQPGNPWPALNVSQLTRSMNFETGAMREESGRSRAEPTGGGAVPLMGQGELRAVALVREGFAWNQAGPNAAPAPIAVAARQHDLWLGTPQGAVKAARKFNATSGTRSVEGRTLNTLSFTVPGAFAATLVLDDSHTVSRIESTLPHPVLGDTAVVTTFSDYRDIGGTLRFPMRVRQSIGSHEVYDVTATQVTVGTPVEIAVPDNVRAFRETASTTPVADGVWFIAGGSHNSVAIEMAGEIVLVEAPLYDGRTLAVFAAANALVPGKKVGTVINSHHHFDHAGGLRAAAGEGATLIVSAAAKPYLERVFANPNRIAPDHFAKSGKAAASARIVGYSGKHVISDGRRTVEVHEIQGSVHAQGFNLVWLPKERLLIEADAYTPGPPNSPPPPAPNANNVNLVQNIERLGLDVDRILPLHSRVVPMSELLAAIGRR